MFCSSLCIWQGCSQFLADRTAVQYDTAVIPYIKSYTSVFLAGMFLFVHSDTFALGYIAQKKRVEDNVSVSFLRHRQPRAFLAHYLRLRTWEDLRELCLSRLSRLRFGTFIKSNRLNRISWLFRTMVCSNYRVHRTRLSTVGDRVFPVAAARVWNSLPDLVTSAPSVAVFRSRLKTHLLNISYPSPLWLYSARAVTLSCFGHYNRSSLLTYLLTIRSTIGCHSNSSASCYLLA